MYLDVTDMAVHKTNDVLGIVIQRAAFMSDTVGGWIVPSPRAKRRDFCHQNCPGGVIDRTQLYPTKTRISDGFFEKLPGDIVAAIKSIA